MTAAAPQKAFRSALPGFLIFLIVLTTYLPAIQGDFLWDDDSNITKSAPLRSISGLAQIWFKPGATQQYYPLTHSSFWLDYYLWGLHTLAYHLENILLHALTAILLWIGLRKLSVPGAWLAAALFAVHPVNVESVAWITERKNCLSGVFFLGSLLSAIAFWRLDDPIDVATPKTSLGNLKFFIASLTLFLCAMLSKTATIGLPFVIALLIWWKHRKITLRDIALLVPFLVAGLSLSFITIWLEKNHLGAMGPEWNYTTGQRCIIAGRALWFYLGKLFWPHPLMFMYPLWKIDAAQGLAFLPFALALALLILLALFAKGKMRPTLVALLYFLVMLFPVLGFFNVVFYHYSFVSDHFQYLALIGPLTLAAALLITVLGRMGERAGIVIEIGSGALVALLAALSFHQAGIYRDPESLWQDTLAHNPQSWMAHDNLGTWYAFKGRFLDASAEHLRALEIRPEDFVAWNDLGLDAARRNKLEDAIEYFERALHIFPDYALAHYNLGNVLARNGKYDEAIEHFHACIQLDSFFAAGQYSLANALERKGDTTGAIAAYDAALKLDPDFAPAHANLGRALAARGDMDGSMEHYRAALNLDPTSLEALVNLANALVAQKKTEDAITLYREALKLNPNSAIIHYNLAVALERSGNHAEEEKELMEATRLKTIETRVNALNAAP